MDSGRAGPEAKVRSIAAAHTVLQKRHKLGRSLRGWHSTRMQGAKEHHALHMVVPIPRFTRQRAAVRRRPAPEAGMAAWVLRLRGDSPVGSRVAWILPSLGSMDFCSGPHTFSRRSISLNGSNSLARGLSTAKACRACSLSTQGQERSTGTFAGGDGGAQLHVSLCDGDCCSVTRRSTISTTASLPSHCAKTLGSNTSCNTSGLRASSGSGRDFKQAWVAQAC